MIIMRMKRVLSGIRAWHIVLLIFMLAFIAVAPPGAQAQIPRYINYQGKLTDANDDPVTGDVNITLRIYDTETGGTALWTEMQKATVTRGIFSILLGNTTALDDLDFDNPYWYSVEVESDGEMTPRQRLTAVGYAINADKIDGYDASQFLRADTDTSLSGNLTVTGGVITGGANEDVTIDPTGTGNIIMKIDSTSGDFKVTDGTTNYVLVDNATGNVTMSNDLTVSGTIYGTIASATGSSTFSNIVVTGTSDLRGNISNSSGAVTVADVLTQTGAANQVSFAGNVDAGNGLDVTGALTVSGTTALSSTLDMNSNIDLDYSGTSSALDVTQASTGPSAQFAGGRVIVGANELTNANALSTGELYVLGDLEVDGTIYGSIDSSGSQSLGATTVSSLTVTGTSDLKGNVSDSGGDFTIQDNLAVTGTSDLQGNVSNSGGTFTIVDDISITKTDSSTSGTATTAVIQPTYQDSGTDSTTTAIAMNVAPTINYTGATKSGSYTALKIAATETSLPTGSNYLIDAYAGSAGTTQVFYVDNSGNAKIFGSLNMNAKKITNLAEPTVSTDAATKNYADTLIGGAAVIDATYITQTTNTTLTNEQALSSLSTGIMKVTTTTGAVSSITDSAGVAGAISDETGSGAMVFGTSPTFTTSITDPLVIGGTLAGSTLTLKSTSGVGTTDAVIFQVGNNGATEAMRIINSGNVGIGTTGPTSLLSIGASQQFTVSSTGVVQTGADGQDGQLTIYSEQGVTDYSVVFQPNSAMTQTTTYILPANDGDANQALTSDGSGALSWTTPPGTGANTALSNLTSVAINTSLISDTANTDDLGTEALFWKKLYLASDISFEGATDDTYQTTLTVVDPTDSDKSINIPNASGTMAVSATVPATLSALGDIGITVLKDLVTTAPLAGGTDDILPGAESDVTLSISATDSATWAGLVTDETGSGKWVFGTAPTFTTSITDPLVIGGTLAGSTLTLKSTSGVGTTDAVIFQVGNNGATEAMRIINSGNVGIGTTTPAGLLEIKKDLSGTPSKTNAAYINIPASTFTDNNTAESGTAVAIAFNAIQAPALAATNASVTTTDAATLYIAGAPTAGTNQTITNAHALWVDAGHVQIDGDLTVSGTLDLGAGVNDDLTAADVTDLTDGGSTTLHTHSGLTPAAHATSHENGGSDVITFDNLSDGTTYKKFLDTERTKLTGIETGADVTDTANVTAAGAIMSSPSVAQTIQPTADAVPLTIKGKASATSSVLSIYDAAASPSEKIYVDSAGHMRVAENTVVDESAPYPSSAATLYFGRNATDNWEAMGYDPTLGTKGMFTFSAPLQVEASSPTGITFVEKNSQGVTIKSQGFMYDPSADEFSFTGGKLKQAFQNLVRGGSFESWNTPGWYSGWYGGASCSTNFAKFGNKSLYMQDTSDTQTVYKAYYISHWDRLKNVPVTLSVWAKCDGGSGTATASIGIGTNASTQEATTVSNISLTTTWQNFTFTSTVPIGATTLKVFLYASAGTSGVPDATKITENGASVYYDGITLVEGKLSLEYGPSPVFDLGDQVIGGSLAIGADIDPYSNYGTNYYSYPRIVFGEPDVNFGGYNNAYTGYTTYGGGTGEISFRRLDSSSGMFTFNRPIGMDAWEMSSSSWNKPALFIGNLYPHGGSSVDTPDYAWTTNDAYIKGVVEADGGIYGDVMSFFGGVGKASNLLKYSEDFTQDSIWLKPDNPSLQITSNILAPDGTLTACKLTGTVNSSITQTITASNNTTYTFSVYLAADTQNYAYIFLKSNVEADWWTWPNYKYVDLYNTTNWRRFSVTYTSPSSGVTSVTAKIMFYGSVDHNSIKVWGAQLRDASSPGIYIKSIDNPVTNSTALFHGDGSRLTNLNVSGTSAITGIAGNTFTINEDLSVSSPPIDSLNIVFNRGNQADSTIIWDETSDKFTINNPVSISSGGLTVAGTITAGTGSNVITTATGLLDATKLSGTVPVGSLPSDGYASTYVNEGQANSITSAMITNYTIINDDISNSAAIAGTKILPDFGSQGITTSGSITTTGAGAISSATTVAASSYIRSLASVGLIPEYDSAVPRPDGADNFGTLSLKYGDHHNYYEWTTNEPTPQDYDIVVRFRLPDGFASFDSSAPIILYTKSSDYEDTNTKVVVQMKDSGENVVNLNGSASVTLRGKTTATLGDWDPATITIGTPTVAFAGGQFVTFIITLYANQEDSIDVGELTLKGNW